MESARFVCNSFADDGNEARMFVNGKVIFFVDLIENHVMTVRYASMPRFATECLVEVAAKELRKKQAKVLEAEREFVRAKAELESEKIDLRLALLKTRSEQRAAALSARLNAVELRLRELAAEVKRERREVTYLAEGIVSLSVSYKPESTPAARY
ncbi:hypothetical protein [Paenibacillus tuaregi]|uniref:hypothetical protein n=1 Tax=Paenibacillus tuaregi TaxID=1816681 RepID=UPI0011DDF120|nr:hypothetical protein [Paenibacillus tuaregi]